MSAKGFCTTFCFLILYTAIGMADWNNVHAFGSSKAALQYDRQLMESEVAKRPHLIMFYAPWYDIESLSCGYFAYYDISYSDKLRHTRSVAYSAELVPSE